VTKNERFEILIKALEKIKEFGHSHGHGRGYTCANIAEKALNESRIRSI
jgi:hypothetical protein